MHVTLHVRTVNVSKCLSLWNLLFIQFRPTSSNFAIRGGYPLLFNLYRDSSPPSRLLLSRHVSLLLLLLVNNLMFLSKEHPSPTSYRKRKRFNLARENNTSYRARFESGRFEIGTGTGSRGHRRVYRWRLVSSNRCLVYVPHSSLFTAKPFFLF